MMCIVVVVGDKFVVEVGLKKVVVKFDKVVSKGVLYKNQVLNCKLVFVKQVFVF